MHNDVQKTKDIMFKTHKRSKRKRTLCFRVKTRRTKENLVGVSLKIRAQEKPTDLTKKILSRNNMSYNLQNDNI